MNSSDLKEFISIKNDYTRNHNQNHMLCKFRGGEILCSACFSKQVGHEKRNKLIFFFIRLSLITNVIHVTEQTALDSHGCSSLL